MKVHTNVKAGGYGNNHNEKQSKSLTVKTGVKAGIYDYYSRPNHNEKQAKSLAVKTGVKAGGSGYNHNEKAVADNK